MRKLLVVLFTLVSLVFFPQDTLPKIMLRPNLVFSPGIPIKIVKNSLFYKNHVLNDKEVLTLISNYPDAKIKESMMLKFPLIKQYRKKKSIGLWLYTTGGVLSFFGLAYVSEPSTDGVGASLLVAGGALCSTGITIHSKNRNKKHAVRKEIAGLYNMGLPSLNSVFESNVVRNDSLGTTKFKDQSKIGYDCDKIFIEGKVLWCGNNKVAERFLISRMNELPEGDKKKAMKKKFMEIKKYKRKENIIPYVGLVVGIGLMTTSVIAASEAWDATYLLGIPLGAIGGLGVAGFYKIPHKKRVDKRVEMAKIYNGD